MFPIHYYLLLCTIFLCTILHVENQNIHHLHRSFLAEALAILRIGTRGIPVADMARQVERGQMHPAIEVAECGMGHDNGMKQLLNAAS
jgi:hypothetical protein